MFLPWGVGGRSGALGLHGICGGTENCGLDVGLMSGDSSRVLASQDSCRGTEYADVGTGLIIGDCCGVLGLIGWVPEGDGSCTSDSGNIEHN